MAFLRVQTGVYDPAIIGDKPKWYSRNLTAVPFNIVEENSTLAQAISSFAVKSNSVEQTPTGIHSAHRSLTEYLLFVLQMKVAVIRKKIVPILAIHLSVISSPKCAIAEFVEKFEVNINGLKKIDG